MANIFSALSAPFGALQNLQPRKRQDNPFGTLPSAPDEAPYESYSPNYDAENRFKALLAQDIEPNKPSLGRKIAASLSGLGQKDPFGYAQGIAYEPYFRQIAEQQRVLPFYQQAADNERLQNQQGISMNNTHAKQIFDEKKLASTEKIAQDRTDLARDKEERQAKNEAERIEIMRARANNANLITKTGDDGYVYVLDKTTGQATKSNLKSDELSDLQKLNLGLDASLAKIAAAGSEVRKTEATRQMNREKLEASRQTNRVQLLNEKNRVWNLLPSQQRQQITNNYEALVRENPKYDDYFEVDPNTGRIGLIDETEGSSGFLGIGASPALDKTTRDMLLKRLNEGVNTPRSTQTVTPVGGNSTNDRVTVTKDGVHNFSLPKAQLQQAISEGYKEVK